VVAAAVLWLAACAALALSARSSVERGVDALDDAGLMDGNPRALLLTDDAQGAAADTAAALDAATAEFDAATRRLDNPLLAPVRLLPVLGRQLRSVETTVAAAAGMSTAATEAIEELTVITDRATVTPEDRILTVRDTTAVLERMQRRIDALDLGSPEALIGPVADAHNRLVGELELLSSTLDTGIVGLVGVADLLEGPNTYLVLAANNAEMRAGSGMYLQAGTVTITDGRFDLGEFVSTTELRAETAGAEMDPDMAARWGLLEPNREWRNLNLSPRFDESARMAAQMWESSGRGAVDGVMSIDVVGLQRLLRLTGPVDVVGPDGETRTYDADSVEEVLLQRQYDEFDDQDLRRQQLGDVVGAVFDAFNQRGVPATDLVEMIDRSGTQRHLLLWSEVPVQQEAWEALGVAGVLPANALMASVLNIGANKLDPYLTVESTLSAQLVDDMWQVEVSVDLANTAPEGLPVFVAGPQPEVGTVAGEYRGVVSLTVPAAATAPTTTADGFVALGDDGPTRVLASQFSLLRGQTMRMTFTFELPAEWDLVEVISAARVPRASWTAGDETWQGGRPRTVALRSLD
jgi:hypothetical protein